MFASDIRRALPAAVPCTTICLNAWREASVHGWTPRWAVEWFAYWIDPKPRCSVDQWNSSMKLKVVAHENKHRNTAPFPGIAPASPMSIV